MKRLFPQARHTVKLRIDHLEDRLTPSAFGPADGAYFVEPWIGNFKDVKIQPIDQKILVTGGRTGNGSVLTLSRYDTAGNADTNYGTNGLWTSSMEGSHQADLVLQSDGKALVSGYRQGKGFGIIRLNGNGSPDNNFGTGGFSSVNLGMYFQFSLAVGLQSTGKVVVGGWISDDTISPSWAALARFSTKGVFDSGKNGFGNIVRNQPVGYTTSQFGNQIADFKRIAVQQDDKVIAVGTLSTSWASGQLLVARYTSAGILDSSFNGTGYTSLSLPGVTYTSAPGFSYSNHYKESLTLQTDGKIVVVSSSFNPGSDILVVRYNTNGSLDTSFGGTGYVQLDIDGSLTDTREIGSDVAIQSDGKIVVAGSVDGGVLVARLDSNGILDSTFGNGGFKTSAPQAGHTFTNRGMTLQSNGNIIVAGIDNDGTNDYPMLMRFYGTASPLNAASTPSTTNTQTITQAQIAPLLTEAISRWRSAGVNTSSLKNINIQIADLPGTTLGQAQGSTITLDSNAAGWGWFVDKTPRSDSEFRMRGNQGEQGRMDLLTVLMHETGHLLGYQHQQSGVMADSLFAGVRLTPQFSLNQSMRSGVNWTTLLPELLALSRKR